MAKTGKVKTLILRTAGTNCDGETKSAFESAGATCDLVHVNKLFNKEYRLEDYHILAIPGGFSYGDDIAAGKILANEFRMRLESDLKKFIADGKLIIGICNGFQILVKAGLLPGALGGQSSANGFTPLEKAADFNPVRKNLFSNGVNWRSSPLKAGGGLKPLSAQTDRKQSSLTGFTQTATLMNND